MPFSKRKLLPFVLVLAFVPVILLVGASEMSSGEEEPMSIEWECASMLFWHPGETKVTAFYVMNQGGLKDSYWLSIECDDPNWSCSLDKDNLWNVSPWEREVFNVSITAPLTADAGDYANIKLAAGSMMVNISDSMSWRAFVIVEKAVTMWYEGDDPVNLNDDMEATWELVVENIGDVWSELQLTYHANESIDKWLTVTIEPTTMTLDPGERSWVNVTLKVHTPSALSSMVRYRTSVRANDMVDKGVWDGKALSWYIPYRYSVTFSPEEKTFPAIPGVEGTLSVDVDQVTNHKDEYVWNLQLDNQKIGWVVRPNSTSIGLKGTTRGVFDIAITSPVTAAPGEMLELRVILTCPQRTDDVLDIMYEFEVITIRLLTIHVTPDEMDLDHGAIPWFSIVLSNHGNIWQPITFGARFGDGTQVRFTDCPTRRVGIPPLNRTSFIVSLALDEDLRPGAHIVEFFAEGEDLGEVKYGVVINVPERVGLSVTHTHIEGVTLNPNPSDEVVSLSLENTGNVQLALSMDYQVSPAMSGIALHPVGIKKDEGMMLDPGERRLLDVVVNVPNFYDGEEYIEDGLLMFTVSHWGGEELWTETITFNMVGPDLAIGRIDWDIIMREGETSIVRVMVENRGTSSAPMSFLSLSGGIDPDGPVVVPVQPLLVGESVTVEVPFLPGDGTNTYTFVVDPEGAIVELGIAPNELTVKKTTNMDSAGDLTEEGWTALTLGAFSLLAVIAAFSVWSIHRRFRKK